VFILAIVILFVLDLDLKESYPLVEAPPRSSVLFWEGKTSISSLSILFASTSSKWLPGQLKFLVISVLLLVSNSFKMSVNAQICTQTPFPKFMGGTSGDTIFFSIDYHSASSQLVVGGGTLDTGITDNDPTRVF
jgi:hypothetical protein